MADPPGNVDSILETLENLSTSKDLSQELQHRLTKQSDRDRVHLLEQEISACYDQLHNWQVKEYDLSPYSATQRWWWTIQDMLERILGDSSGLRSTLSELTYGPSPSERDLVGQDRGSYPSLKKAEDLARHIDESARGLRIIVGTMAAFEPLGNQPAGSNGLLRLAAESRAASRKLYDLTMLQTKDCNIELELPRAGEGIRYRLVIEPGEKMLQHVAVENVKAIDACDRDSRGDVEFAEQDAQIFEPGLGTKVIGVPRIGTDSPAGMDPISYLCIPCERPAIIHLDSSPESLVEILRDRKRRAEKSEDGHWSKGAKTELAFKIVECGLFLLGSPLFSRLSSKHIRKFSGGQSTQPTFMLRTAKPPGDLITLTGEGDQETYQLFRLGLLLMEIALETPDTEPRAEWVCTLDLDTISKLALVERAIGADYGKATAFCLCYRYYQESYVGRVQRSEGRPHAALQEFLQDFLERYYSRVYCV